MKLIYLKSFQKKFEKLTFEQQKRVQKALQLFTDNPNDRKLANHALQGKLEGYRSISAGYDLRIIFQERDHYFMVILINVGNHNQVY